MFKLVTNLKIGIVTEISTWRACEIFIFVFLPFVISYILSFVSISSVLFIYGFNDDVCSLSPTRFSVTELSGPKNRWLFRSARPEFLM